MTAFKCVVLLLVLATVVQVMLAQKRTRARYNSNGRYRSSNGGYRVATAPRAYRRYPNPYPTYYRRNNGYKNGYGYYRVNRNNHATGYYRDNRYKSVPAVHSNTGYRSVEHEKQEPTGNNGPSSNGYYASNSNAGNSNGDNGVSNNAYCIGPEYHKQHGTCYCCLGACNSDTSFQHKYDCDSDFTPCCSD